MSDPIDGLPPPPGPDEVVATLRPSPPRRWFAIGVLGLLGALLIYIALATPPGLGYAAMLLAFGGGALWLAGRLHAATARPLILTGAALMEEGGRTLARIDDIRAVDRGVFAFKPSNGFLLTLSSKAPRAWAPGLWWRIGRRIGVGGVMRAAETRSAAEAISLMLAGRDR